MVDKQPATSFRFVSSALSDRGGRQYNEDSFVDRAEAGIWAVADGVGGHFAGDVASAAIRDALTDIAPTPSLADNVTLVRQRLQVVHQALRIAAARQTPPATIASTVVVLFVAGTQYVCLWAGDSRAYRLRDGVLTRQSKDHSLVQELLDAGSITAAQAARHPRSNVITRAVGVEADAVELEERQEEVRAGDRFLLCSDGLSNAVDDAMLRELLGGADVTRTAAALIQAALTRATNDNVTAVAIEVHSTS